MNTWVRRIEEFSRLPHKNISVQIQNTTSEELETVLDAIAKDADWTNKEIKAKNGYNLLSYQTKGLPVKDLPNLRLEAIRYLDYQTIEIVFVLEGDAVLLNIESRYSAPKNKLALFLRYLDGFPFGASAMLFTPYDRNGANIQYILAGLRMYFKDRITVLDKTETERRQEANIGKISMMSVLLAFTKIVGYLFTFVILFSFLSFLSYLLLHLLREVYSSFVSVLSNLTMSH
jgi:hypothetical protein